MYLKNLKGTGLICSLDVPMRRFSLFLSAVLALSASAITVGRPRSLRVCSWNPLSLSGERLEEADRLFAEDRLDLVGLSGTQKKASPTRPVRQIKTKGGFIVEAGWREGRDTNRSAGVSLWLGKTFLKAKIKQVQVPPAHLAGRGLALRVQSGNQDLQIIVAYFPPRPPPLLRTMANYERAVSSLLTWIIQVLAATPSRCMPIVMTDLNSPLKQRMDIDSVGPLSSKLTSFAGIEMAEAMHQLNMIALNTFKGTGDNTYYGDKNSYHIDFIFVPKATLAATERVQMFGD